MQGFNYHAYIPEYDTHIYPTGTSGGVGIGIGPNTLSDYDLADFTRAKWDTCPEASDAFPYSIL
ncbi:hypothetical protein N7448_009007 [Penicillium atrosanguineum]|uniref:Uncharacterized protein n=1 Tax=Penicillium atrosanguineum TaxID=1132637 RepID=A0A9W9GL18_9EURO|nr:uncharacterized protein N7443_006253 [Penicillium atrosanguineum]KAJ5122910.1 hypothetical protein N7448_009007 [Penicillium atrosanguineum]KAJ5137210.1 hypothetical protein N7526_003443 [Penicillium atrosanguineum]KAJ5298133.1 hypothetical protein N7443_006253 [Penicillium atrosanguineum]KAJ5321598.1 hypothetical protein N7476_004600 [Penicillium atrosanguineum]